MPRWALALAVLFFALAPLAARAQRRHREPTPAQIEQARNLFGEGTQHYQAGRLDEALERFLSAWRLVPSPELAYNVARTYERMGDAQHGVEFYRHYLQQAAPDADERQDVERRIGELEAIAHRQREQIIALPPSQDELTQEARTFFERGVAMFRRHRYEAAMAAFTAAYNFARLPEVIYNLAVTAERLDRTQDAIDYFREYARSLPRESAERPMIDRRVEQLRARQRGDR
jgi:tetratricopeptide (TPR) repeat protein